MQAPITYEFLPAAIKPQSANVTVVKIRKGRSNDNTHAALWPSGTLASTALISAGPKPVAVLLCLGLLMPGGPTAVVKSLIGAEVLGLRSRGAGAVVGVAMFVVAREEVGWVREW